jgi:hypothetical protein
MTRIIKVRPLQVYFYSYLIHVSSSFTTKSVVSGTANNFIGTPVYYRPSVSFQLACNSLSQELSLNPTWASFTATSLTKHKQLSNSYMPKTSEDILSKEGQSGDTNTTLSQKQAESLSTINTVINLTTTP